MSDNHPSSGDASRLRLLTEIGGLLDRPDARACVVPILDALADALDLDLYLCHLKGEDGVMRPIASRGITPQDAARLAPAGTVPSNAAAVLIPLGIGAFIHLPIAVAGAHLGSVLVGIRRGALAAADVTLIEIVCRQLALALDRERLEGDLRHAATALQGALASSEITLLQLDAVFRSINEGIIITGLDGAVLAMNPAALGLLGFEDIEECNRHFDNYLEVFQAHYLDSEMVPVEEWPVQRIVRGESFTNIEVYVRRLDTGRSWMGSFSGAPVRNRDGEIILAAITMRDITAEKEARRELKEAKRAAETANRIKDRFLGVLSHELRTPLMPALTLSHLLESDPALPSHLREHAEMIRRNVEVESLLIDDLIDLTLIDKGKLGLDRRSMSLHRLVDTLLDEFAEDIARKGLRLTKALGAPRPSVDADALRLKQALRSLIKTVINMAGAGDEITIRTADGGDGRVRLTVAGSGRGMSAPLLRRLFERSGEPEEPVTTGFGGAGLSLAVGRALIELHGGTVTVEGKDDSGGAALQVELPAADAEESPPEDTRGESVPRGEALRVLVVEDHEDTSRVMRSLLDRDGYRVSVASSVAGAIAAAAAERFDLLICDIALPDGTGFDVMREISRNQKVRGLAVSGYGSESDVQRSIEAGFQSHLTKPVTYQKLHDAIERLQR